MNLQSLQTASPLLSASLIALLVAAVFYRYFTHYARNPSRLPYPPGPKRRVFVGNLHDLPRGGNEWLKYRDLSEKYGSDIIYLQVLGNSIMAINSVQAANDLLDKKGAIYSDRPRLVMLKELMGWEWNLVLMSYGPRFFVHRRIVQQQFLPSIVAQSCHPVIEKEVRVFLENLLDTPDNFVHHLKSMAGAIIMMITYGHQVSPQGDEYVDLAERVRETGVGAPGNFLVDSLPVLKYIPEWFPGAAFKRYARKGRELSVRMRSAPYSMVKQRIASGTAVPSMVASLLESDLQTEGIDRHELIMNCGGVVYSAGADTTVSALTNFFLAMMLYPEVQQKAHEELDRVFGQDRLPDIRERSSLPYIDGIVKESLRWQPVSPLGVAHTTTEDDQYRGMYIPKGTTVIANIWAMLHDEAVYADPARFNPDRYAQGEPDPARAVFGFGRRICPGRHLADWSIRERTGIEPQVTHGSGLVSVPSPFKCKIFPRSDKAESIIRAQTVLGGSS
ncbi:O-methylsterigmatocystin oxidoreductase [Grifola frondosa]|uniref:O-methylsterigmatocystin oxidoreductase n=1 Tax=Grifola frondosa TaxID=5627 RepID=A0A1C7MSN9_GRIFR|nr:O-methylsterigmatocystin oxidoreductase [Grifola frondosa]